MARTLIFKARTGAPTEVFRIPEFRWWQLVTNAAPGQVLEVGLKQGNQIARLPDVLPGQPSPVNVAFDHQNTILVLSSPAGADFDVFLNLIL